MAVETPKLPGRTAPLRASVAVSVPLRLGSVWRRAAQGGDPPSSSRSGSEGEAAEREQAAAGPRVLVVDDEAAIRLLCRVNLRLAGMEVLEAADGATALEIARRERPDIVLLDVMMPSVDGWTVVDELARDAGTRDIPVVFLTARSERIDQRRGLEAGAVAYVTKPFDPVRLAPFLQDVLGRIERGEGDQLRAERLDELGDA